jgi:hypothetical protein
MAKKKLTIVIPKAVKKKRKAPKSKKVAAIAIPKAEKQPIKQAIKQANTFKTNSKPKRRNNKNTERPLQQFSTGDMQNTILADAFAKAGITADSFKKK